MSADRAPLATLATLAELADFDEIIDVRSPAEFAADHIPGAINCPVLDNAQRIEVGTLYKQASPFEAKKIGAALVAENIGRHLREHFLGKARDWKPLIYCWRGGNRSGSMTTIFRAIGWKANQLEGGYKTWRSHVVTRLEQLPPTLDFRVICGATGSAKTRILQGIGALGEQVLDLETLACHKGSVLGILPGQPQPDQKWFETLLLQELERFDPARPVYVEAESRKIGRLHVPDALIARIRAGECLNIDASLAARISLPAHRLRLFPEHAGTGERTAGGAEQSAQPGNDDALAGNDRGGGVAGAGSGTAGIALRPALPAFAESQLHRLPLPE